MLIFRLISFSILTSLFLFSILTKSYWAWAIFAGVGALAAFMVVCEVLTLVGRLGKGSYKMYSGWAAAFTLLLIFLDMPAEKVILIPTFYIMGLWGYLLIRPNKELVLSKIITSIGGTFMAILPLCFIAAIYMVGEGTSYEGRYLLLYLVLVTKAGDTFAFVVGMLSNRFMKGGNHKIAPNLSPKKSWEGALGGLFFSILVSYLLKGYILGNSSLITPFILGFLLYWGGFYGDLAESALKRVCGVKDSGAIIPGMGGAYDVLDSLMFNAPLFYAYLFYFGI